MTERAVPGSPEDATGSDPTAGPAAQADEQVDPRHRSDRVLGIICLIIGLWYTIEARSFETTAFGSGPVGPKTMPTGVGVAFIAIAGFLLARPDQSPEWPALRSRDGAAWKIGLVLACSYLYGRLIEPVGFIAASAAMMIIIGVLFRAPGRYLAPAAVIFPVTLAFVFNNLLELQLPDGWWGGF